MSSMQGSAASGNPFSSMYEMARLASQTTASGLASASAARTASSPTSELFHCPPRARRNLQRTNAARSALFPCSAYQPLPAASSMAAAACRASWPASSAAAMASAGRCFESLPGNMRPISIRPPNRNVWDTSYSTILHLTTGEGEMDYRSEDHWLGTAAWLLIDRSIAPDRSHVCERTIRMEEIDA